MDIKLFDSELKVMDVLWKEGDTPASAATSFNVSDIQFPAFWLECILIIKHIDVQISHKT